MIQLSKLVKLLKNEKLGPVTGVPCSVFKDFLNYIQANKTFDHYSCSSEGESMGIAAGFALAGKFPIVYMQNDGYGNAINPLSSLQLMYKLPALLMISWRGEPNKKDAPQHKLMGKTILDLLSIFEIPYSIIDEENYEEKISSAKKYMKLYKKPYALIFKKGILQKFNKEQSKNIELNFRHEYIQRLNKQLKDDDIILGTTGFTGRELFQTTNHKAKFYMMGSMGCLASIGLGLAKSYPEKRIFVLDGDGALLMKLGTLSTIGNYSPNNLIHICFDNNNYESTGGQKTTSNSSDFVSLAKSCNYKESLLIENINEFESILDKIDSIEKPLFLHVKIKSGTIENLKRPSISPVEMKKTFMENL